MDVVTLAAAINIMQGMPDNAAASAAAAKADADRAEAAADSVTTATVAETKSYLGL
jgi:hypothetical protein